MFIYFYIYLKAKIAHVVIVQYNVRKDTDAKHQTVIIIAID